MSMNYLDGLGFLVHPDNVARAIRDMVTQSMGPWLASAYGMVLAAHAINK